uniref:SERTA domain-containing protein n=1 Tax=Graphocephala atropunctata TaxID=36148 RepID=A0A1B6LTT6_9HEMI
MWCDFQDSQSMGLQGTTCKRKLECDSASPSKMSRVDDWMSDQYLPSGNTRYQYYSGYSSPALSEERPAPCYQSQSQQTIRRDENGKSYLELGSYSSTGGKCCEGRTNWCARGPSCYRQRRLAVLNISMCKLGRYRQYSDPSLHRSVLICNTLRLIEREMEQEGYFSASQSQPPAAEPAHQPFPEVPHSYEPPRAATPFPSVADDSLSDDRTINWGSVLSLSSQSDLDPLNNNDSDPELEDFLPSWKLTPDDILRRSSDSSELDSIMHVLVGT